MSLNNVFQMGMVRYQPLISWTLLALYGLLVVGAGNYKLCFDQRGSVAFEPMSRLCAPSADADVSAAMLTTCLRASDCTDVLLRAGADAKPSATARASLGELYALGNACPVVSEYLSMPGWSVRTPQPLDLTPPCPRSVHLRAVVLLV